jgi:hypothetical protein
MIPARDQHGIHPCPDKTAADHAADPACTVNDKSHLNS